MSHYKGINVWFNELQGKWLVQAGYEILAAYNTLQGAKCAITTKWSK